MVIVAGRRVSAGGHAFGPGGSVEDGGAVKDNGALPFDVDDCGGVVSLASRSEQSAGRMGPVTRARAG